MKRITSALAIAALLVCNAPAMAQSGDNGSTTTQSTDTHDDSGKWGLAGLLGLLGLIGLKGKDRDKDHNRTSTNR